jgi:hypothetical protein
MGALDALYSKNTKKENLSERRKKLSELLLNEQKELEVRLQTFMSAKNTRQVLNFVFMKPQVELRQQRSARGGQAQDMKTR